MKSFCCLLSAAVFGVFACLYGLRADRGLQNLLWPRNRSPPATSLLPFVSGLPLYLHQSEGSEATPLGGEGDLPALRRLANLVIAYHANRMLSFYAPARDAMWEQSWENGYWRWSRGLCLCLTLNPVCS
uniref:Uncharacterized protein n=1 Tax=Zea mays TaxID=4577 RepID=A0A804LN77_MAIZE